MDKIAEKLKAYIDTHPLDLGEGDCETALDQLHQAYAESHESDPSEIGEGLKNWKNSSVTSRWKITTPSSTSAAACVAHMNTKHLLMGCPTGVCGRSNEIDTAIAFIFYRIYRHFRTYPV